MRQFSYAIPDALPARRRRNGGIPFPIEMPHSNQSIIAAMEEARRISRDPSVPGYDNMDDLKKASKNDISCKIYQCLQEGL